MKFDKPTVRIALVKQFTLNALGNKVVMGPDFWQVTVKLQTPEGQSSVTTLCGMKKEEVLSKAYHNLAMCLKHETLDYKHAMNVEKACNVPDEWAAKELRASEARNDYITGKITREKYYELRAAGYPERPSYVEVPAPPPKWRLRDWFK